MPLIWCSISGHGFGHAAQTVPVLNELGSILPNLKVLLRTTVPRRFFDGRLSVEWELDAELQDIGCAQEGPLRINREATWADTLTFHDRWDARLDREIRAMAARSPDLVLSNVSYLAVEAGAKAGLPTVAMSSLTWDQILEPLATPGDMLQRGLIDRIRQAYRLADRLIRVTPGMPFAAFPGHTDIGPIVRPLAPDRAILATALKADPGEHLVLVGFGGIAVDRLPLHRLDTIGGYRFIVSDLTESRYARIHPSSSLSLSFGSLIASADLVVTKPGYNMTVETVTMGKPTVYVRRDDFAEEDCLVQFSHRHGRALRLSAEDFESGRWGATLDAVRALPAPPHAPPAPTGAAEAAKILASCIR